MPFPAILARMGLTALAFFINLTAVRADDSHAGYYYPEPQTREVYVSPMDPLPQAGKRSRVALTVGLAAQQAKLNHAPGYHLFAKGDLSQKMIIVATGSGHYDTLYRMRGLLAALTSQARTSPLFRQTQQPESMNFLDLLRMAGFTQLTVSDGNKFAHRIALR